MQLAQQLRREGVDRHHTPTLRLHGQASEARRMLRIDRSLEHRLDQPLRRRRRVRGMKGRKPPSQQPQQEPHGGLTQPTPLMRQPTEMAVRAKQSPQQSDQEQRIARVGDVAPRHVAIDRKDRALLVGIV